MRAIEFIRELLDFIEDIESNQKNAVDYETENPDTPVTTKLANSPDERVTPTDTILSIGNDLQKQIGRAHV